MAYQLIIPAQFAASFMAGEVALMSTAAGATTTLVGSGGAIVGTAALAPAGGSAVVAAGAALAPVLLGVGLAVGAWLVLCGLAAQAPKPAVPEGDTELVFEGDADEALALLERAQAFVTAETATGELAPVVRLRPLDESSSAA